MLRNRVDRLRDAGGGMALGCQIDARRIQHRFLRHFVQLGRHGRGEHHRLPLSGHEAENPLQIGSESHVHHPVGFVQDQDADVVEPERHSSMQVEKASGRGDQEVEPLRFQHLLLRGQRDAAEDDANAKVGEARVVARVRLDLRRQFARRGEHEGAKPLGSAEKASENRKNERCRLSCARLRGADDVDAGEDQGDSFRLNRRRLDVSGRANSLDDCRW